MGAFGALLGCVVIARQVAVRVLAAALAFVPAMLFGVAAVNKYYDYYPDLGLGGRRSHPTGPAVAPLRVNRTGGGPGPGQPGEPCPAATRRAVLPRCLLAALRRASALISPMRASSAPMPSAQAESTLPGGPQDGSYMFGRPRTGPTST